MPILALVNGALSPCLQAVMCGYSISTNTVQHSHYDISWCTKYTEVYWRKLSEGSERAKSLQRNKQIEISSNAKHNRKHIKPLCRCVSNWCIIGLEYKWSLKLNLNLSKINLCNAGLNICKSSHVESSKEKGRTKKARKTYLVN